MIMINCKAKQLRIKNTITQRQFADKILIRYPTISEMECGASKMYVIDNLDKLCSFFL